LTVPCPTCGRLNRPGANFCAACQTPLNAPSLSQGQAVGPVQNQMATSPLPGQLLDGGTYRILRPLGKGGMGAVYLVAQTKAFDRPAVLKEVIEYFDPADSEASRNAAERFEAEARTLGDLKHPGIPDLYAFFSEAGHNYLVMEYIEGRDLSVGLTHEDRETAQVVPGSALPADDVLRYTIQVCEVLEYLAGRQPAVVHNDIKPGNIILDSHSQRAVLVDFGTAKTRYLQPSGQPRRRRESVYGTVGYAAPELYRGLAEPRSDVYSLAATAYHLLTDDDPRNHPAQYPELATLPPRLAGILEAALAAEVADRLTATQFRQQFEDYLAGQTGPLRGLAFPGGGTASSLDELLELGVKQWRYTASLLQDGTLARWLRNTLRDLAAAEAAEEAVRAFPADADAALDAFVRRLAPGALPAGKMELVTRGPLDLRVEAGNTLLQEIQVTNRGRSYLRGEIFATQPWLKVPAGVFGCSPGETCAIRIEIDPAGLAPGRTYAAGVTLQPAGGVSEVIAVGLTVPDAKAGEKGAGTAPIRVRPNRVELRASRAALGRPRAQVTVTNTGLSPVRCRVLGAPRWLLIEPESFRLAVGSQQDIDLIPRADRLEGREGRAEVVVVPEGGPGQKIDVVVRLVK